MKLRKTVDGDGYRSPNDCRTLRRDSSLRRRCAERLGTSKAKTPQRHAHPEAQRLEMNADSWGVGRGIFHQASRRPRALRVASVFFRYRMLETTETCRQNVTRPLQANSRTRKTWSSLELVPFDLILAPPPLFYNDT